MPEKILVQKDTFISCEKGGWRGKGRRKDLVRREWNTCMHNERKRNRGTQGRGRAVGPGTKGLEGGFRRCRPCSGGL